MQGLFGNVVDVGERPLAKRTARETPAAPDTPPTRKAAPRAAPKADAQTVAHAPLSLGGPHDVDGHALVRAEQCIAVLQRRLMKPLGRGGPRGELTLTQYHALSFLAARGQASVSDLRDVLAVAQSTASVLVDKLSKLGLVERTRDARDHRVAAVVPLPKGLRMVQRYRKNAERNLLALTAAVGDEAVRAMFAGLESALVATAPLEDARVALPEAETDDDDDDDDALAAQ